MYVANPIGTGGADQLRFKTLGALTAENYAPSEELKNREPKKSADELPFYSMP